MLITDSSKHFFLCIDVNNAFVMHLKSSLSQERKHCKLRLDRGNKREVKKESLIATTTRPTGVTSLYATPPPR